MYSRRPKGMIKHLDFMLMDIITMFIAYIIVYAFLKQDLTGIFSQLNLFVLVLYLTANLAVSFLGESYKNILKRGYAVELQATIVHTGIISMVVIAILYLVKIGQNQSRLQMAITFLVYTSLSYICRVLQKHFLRKKGYGKDASALMIITVKERAERAVLRLTESCIDKRFQVVGICVMDEDQIGKEIHGIPVVANKDTLIDYVCHHWVDEVIFEMGHGYIRPDQELMEQFLKMGITTHAKLYRKDNDWQWERSVESMGPYMVLTRSMKVISIKERVAKRCLDILGGLVGTLIMILLLIIVGPIIYISSPGPIFFSQERIGMNGRHFKMYKFRSMVMNADELKKQYMDKNRVGDGMMFKLDWDPRIIGNKELPDGTKKTGIGEFIRKTSIDEFPQFLNVLKGDMSLVGTRPPTLDEWEKYDIHHRTRMAVRPGITGMWQVSGRSEITDFEEVVRLDTDYIAKWSFGLDLRILLKTVTTVLARQGSM